MPPLIHEAIEARVSRHADRIAVDYAETLITYGDLWRRARSLAERLREAGVGPEVVVGAALERSAELPIAALGILLTGGAYLPLDPAGPVRRLAFMMSDANVGAVVVQAGLRDALPPYGGPVLTVAETAETAETDGQEAGQTDVPARLEGGAAPDNLAYVIHTSGSTGRPKGVMTSHRSIANRLAWMQDAYRLTPDDRVLHKTPIGFDVSVWELFWPLMAGARQVVAPPGAHGDPAALIETINRAEVSTLHFVPSMLRAFLAAPGVETCASIRRVICSGEALAPDLAARLYERLPGARLHNLYGPTEAAIDVTAWDCHPGAEVIPIGRPIANVHAYVVDDRVAPVGPGEAGELLIGGVAPARGYVGRPGLTAEVFVPDHLSGTAGARLYRTGDRVRARADGVLEFLGRLDDQVKIRGVRVEPGEIETVLARHEGVAAAAVAVRPDEAGERRLIGYAVPDPRRAGPVARLLQVEREGVPVPAVQYDLPDGRTVLVPNRTEAEFVAREVFDEARYKELGVDASPGGCVVDVGAHVGLFTLYAARSGAKVYGFEPIPPLFELLRRNMEVHGVRVGLFPCAVGRAEGESRLTYYPNLSIMSGRHADPELDRRVVRSVLAAADSAAPGPSAVDAVLDRSLQAEHYVRPVRRLSAVLREQGIARVDLLKIDVERSEEEVLDGIDGADWARIRQVLVEVHDTGGRLDRLTARFRSLGYRVRTYRDPALAGTDLVTVAAVRPAPGPPPAPGREPEADAVTWAGPRRLVAELRRHTREWLPAAAIPAIITLVDELPLTPSGKLDRAALPTPRVAADAAWSAPKGPIQERLAAIWAQLLGLDAPGADDDFFELGGHSLLATELVSRIRGAFNVEVPLEAVFTARTVARLAGEVAIAPPAGQVVPPIVPVRRDRPLPLSFSQERLWFMQQLHPGIRAYQFQATVELTGRLDPRALSRALTEIVRRHEIYRTTFVDGEDGPCQVVHPPFPVDPGRTDLRGTAAPDAAARALIHAEIAVEIPIDRLPLVRWRLLRVADDRHILLHIEHHLVHDGWAFNIFLNELCALYEAYAAGEPSPLPEPRIQFADFAVWQREQLDGPVAERQIDYWRAALRGVPQYLELSARPYPLVRRFTGDAPRIELPAATADRARELARREDKTLFMVMLAAFQVLLYDWSGQEEFCVGSGIANRRWPGTERLLGMIVNTVALRADLRGDPTFRELLTRVQATTLGAYANQDVPYDRVVAALRPVRKPGRQPLCQVLFSFHDSPLRARVQGLEIEVVEGIANGTAKFDLNIIAIPRAEQLGRDAGRAGGVAGGITLIWEYDGDLFEHATIAAAAERYRRLLAAAIADPPARLSDLTARTRGAHQSAGPETADKGAS